MDDKQSWKARAKHPADWDNTKKVLHYQSLPYILEIIWIELINKYHNNLLVNFFGTKKTQECIAWKY